MMTAQASPSLTSAQRSYLERIGGYGANGMWDGHVINGPGTACVRRLIARGMVKHQRIGMGHYYVVTEAGLAALSKREARSS